MLSHPEARVVMVSSNESKEFLAIFHVQFVFVASKCMSLLSAAGAAGAAQGEIGWYGLYEIGYSV